jgi:hypothetical protein
VVTLRSADLQAPELIKKLTCLLEPEIEETVSRLYFLFSMASPNELV